MTKYEKVKAWRRANPEKYAAQKRRNRARNAARREVHREMVSSLAATYAQIERVLPE